MHMLFHRPLLLTILLILLLVGNVLAFMKLTTDPSKFLSAYPRMTMNTLSSLKAIQALNVLAIVGIWYFQKWGAWLALALAMLVLALDIHYSIWYHAVVVVLLGGLTAHAVITNWPMFQ